MEPNGDNDLETLKAENQRLKAEFRALVVEKNLMEERMYRAMNHVLNAKKKHLKRLERQVASLKKAGNGESEHCGTCRCGKDSEDEEVGKAVRMKKRTTAAPVIISDEDDNTQDPGSDYGSETDIDDIPASKHASPQKTPGTVLAGSDGDSTPERMDVPEEDATTSSGKHKNTPEPEEIPAAEKEIPETSEPVPSKGAAIDKPESGLSNSQNSQNTDYDMDELVDEFCG